MIKIFPAAAFGPNYIKQLKGPIDNIDFVAVGGVKLQTTKDYINAGCCAIAIGASVIKKQWVENSNWNEITREVKKYKIEIQTP